MRLNFNLGFLKGFRWRIQSREHERSSLHWLAGETWQTVKNLMCCFHIVNQCIPDVLRLLEKKNKTTITWTFDVFFSREAILFLLSLHDRAGMRDLLVWEGLSSDPRRSDPWLAHRSLSRTVCRCISSQWGLYSPAPCIHRADHTW